MTPLTKEEAEVLLSRLIEHIDVRMGQVRDLVENGRSQNSAEHSAFEYGQRVLRDATNKMLAQWDRMWRTPAESPKEKPPGKP